jgi:antitoxin component HigA of HigAB toxin-antitoxin module
MSSLNTENLKPETQAWPDGLPEQVSAIRKLLPTIGQDPESLAACFGRKNKKRTDQITGILATLKSLGLIA